MIKNKKIKNIQSLEYIQKELNILKPIKDKYDNDDLLNKLKIINETLWDIENAKRQKEKDKIFDEKFIELARNVYIWNDKRSEIKSEINNYFKSDIIDVKEYTYYK